MQSFSHLLSYQSIFPRRLSFEVPLNFVSHLPSKEYSYSTLHKIVHCESQLLVREIFMCFEVICIVHVSSHSIFLKNFEIIVIVHCPNQPTSRNHNFSTNCTDGRCCTTSSYAEKRVYLVEDYVTIYRIVRFMERAT